jgi:oxepin-CoA hydrolase/3-oxo-5,6-dehydrosuberyl-CoA semialdehyde dehydrogenase
MTSIRFDVNDPELRDTFFRQLLGGALATLEETSRPRWGRMTPQQMVEHLEWVFEVSTGHAIVECAVPEARRERFKAFLYDNTPMLHEFRNPALAAGLPSLRHPGLPEAKAALALEVARFLDQCGAAPPTATHTHPVFGPIDAEEWARSHFKHAYHHLLQFDLVEEQGSPVAK